jgi:acetolactate synthase-1/2/3 large subunit
MGNVEQSYIEVGQTRSLVDKRFVRRPLEDQEPFLPRDLFLKEMIVKPIDQ